MSSMNKEEKKEYKLASRNANLIDEKTSYGGITGYGLCSKCSYFAYREYEFGHKSTAQCAHHHGDGFLRLNPSLRITKCNDFSERGALSLEAMWLMAKHIEIKKDRVVGFSTSDADETDLYMLSEEIDD